MKLSKSSIANLVYELPQELPNDNSLAPRQEKKKKKKKKALYKHRILMSRCVRRENTDIDIDSSNTDKKLIIIRY